MTITVRSPDPLTSVVEVGGELDLYAAAELNAQLARAIDERCRRLVIDVRDVTRIDFSTIAIIAQTGRLLRQRHGTVEVVCDRGEIAQLLVAAAARGNFEVTFADDAAAS